MHLCAMNMVIQSWQTFTQKSLRVLPKLFPIEQLLVLLKDTIEVQ